MSLQQGPREAEYPEAETVTTADYLDTANVITDLDLIITVDTSVAHLAGAMGKPTWTLLPAVPDFRWMMFDRDATPWYSSMRLFRQSAPGDWTGVIQRVQAALEERLTLEAA